MYDGAAAHLSAGTEVAEQHRIHGIYVADSATANFAIGRAQGIWGVTEPDWLADVRVGDRLAFVHDIPADKPVPAGFPRVPEQAFRGTARAIVYGEVTSEPTTSKKAVWADAAYPGRFNFREIATIRTTHFSADEFQRRW